MLAGLQASIGSCGVYFYVTGVELSRQGINCVNKAFVGRECTTLPRTKIHDSSAQSQLCIDLSRLLPSMCQVFQQLLRHTHH